MTDFSIEANFIESAYNVLIDFGDCVFPIKLDIGANCTVISVDAYIRGISDDNRKRIVRFCEEHCKSKKKFTSASGDEFYGYPVLAYNVYIGDVLFEEFFYYVVVENKRVISLLGVDFMDCCDYEHVRHESIIISGFDRDYYCESLEFEGLDSNELIEFIDTL